MNSPFFWKDNIWYRFTNWKAFSTSHICWALIPAHGAEYFIFWIILSWRIGQFYIVGGFQVYFNRVTLYKCSTVFYNVSYFIICFKNQTYQLKLPIKIVFAQHSPCNYRMKSLAMSSAVLPDLLLWLTLSSASTRLRTKSGAVCITSAKKIDIPRISVLIEAFYCHMSKKRSRH